MKTLTLKNKKTGKTLKLKKQDPHDFNFNRVAKAGKGTKKA